MERRPNTQSVSWFLEMVASGQLELEPSFQRRTVWSLGYKRAFIDTLLRGLPSPAIFLAWTLKPGEPTIYNVVDGKQRLTSIIDFTNDRFHLANLFAEEGYRNPYWSDLSDSFQMRFLSYVISVENLSGASDEELRDVFDRLNRNVDRLTQQELRHAQFPGLFLERMEALAADSFWLERRIVTPSHIRRMRDVEFISELFVLTLAGVQDGDPDVLDEFYATHDEEIPDEDVHRAHFDAVRDYLASFPLEWWPRHRWRNMNDLYSLWGALDAHLRAKTAPTPEDAQERLAQFSETQAALLQADRDRKALPGESADQRYFGIVRQGANKQANREERQEILIDVLRG